MLIHNRKENFVIFINILIYFANLHDDDDDGGGGVYLKHKCPI